MTTPKGPTPSLIGSTMGSTKFVTTGKRGKLRTCKRCKSKARHAETCVEISIPNSMNHNSYCLTCFGSILDSTQKKLDALRSQLAAQLKTNA